MINFIKNFIKSNKFNTANKAFLLFAVLCLLLSFLYSLHVRFTEVEHISGHIATIHHYHKEEDTDSKYIELTLVESGESYYIGQLFYNEIEVQEFFNNFKSGSKVEIHYFPSILDYFSRKDIHFIGNDEVEFSGERALRVYRGMAKWTLLILSLLLILISVISLFQNYVYRNVSGKLTWKVLSKGINLLILAYWILPIVLSLFIPNLEEEMLTEVDSKGNWPSSSSIGYIILGCATINTFLFFGLNVMNYEISEKWVKTVNRWIFIILFSPFQALFFLMAIESYANYSFREDEIQIVGGEITRKQLSDDKDYGIITIESDEYGSLTKDITLQASDTLQLGDVMFYVVQKGYYCNFFIIEEE